MSFDSEKHDVAPVSPIDSEITKVSDRTYDPEACEPKKTRSWSWSKLWRTPPQLTAGPTQTSTQPDPHPTITRTLDGSPEGYPRVATLKCSDRNFMQFRSFGYLHTRVVLSLQREIENLETQLDELDDFDASEHGDPHKLTCKGSDDEDTRPDCRENEEFQLLFEKTRPQILIQLKEKLMEYDEVLLKTKEVMALQKPSTKDYESVRNWLVGKQPLVPPEIEYIQKKEDIITLRTGRECASFDSFVERALSRLDRFLVSQCNCRMIQHIFLTPELRAKTTDKHIHYYAPGRVDTLVNIIITFFIFILMVLPVVALYEMSNIGTANPFEAIGILIVFTLLFGCAMSGLTRATRQELFGASAAYCAVLVVFISNFSPQTVTIST